MNREELSPKALEMMKAHSLDEVYVTSDGQGFTEKHRAEAQASLLKNKKIEHFVKSKEAVAKIETEDPDEDIDEYNRRIAETLSTSTEAFKTKTEETEGNKEILNVSTDATTNIETDETDEDNQEDERTVLVAKYEFLFNKKPAHNIGVEKLKTQIAEKEAELENIPVNVQDTTKPATPIENPTEEIKD